MKIDFEINNDIIIWAIERSGYELGDFFNLFPKVQEWLEKRKRPTIKQLEAFAKKVHLPFGYLFLETPPEERLPIPFFRTIRSSEKPLSLNVYDTILLLQKRQEWLAGYLHEDDYAPLDFVGRYNTNATINKIVNDIRTVLNLNTDWANTLPNWEKAKDHLSEVIEEAGIFVVFNSIVGSNTHRKIKVEDCRGLVLVNNYAPLMFINSADSKAAQMFTLAHELAHIWLGQSAGFDLRQLQPADNKIEILCDKIAAEFLVPEDILLSIWHQYNSFENLARYFKVSQIVIARRALDLGKINLNRFLDFYNDYINRDYQKKENQEGGGNYYSTQKKRLSTRFLNFINKAVKENKLLMRDAYNLTGMKGNTYHTFMKEHLF